MRKWKRQLMKWQRVSVPIDVQADGSNHDDTVVISHEEKKGDVTKEENRDDLEITE